MFTSFLLCLVLQACPGGISNSNLHSLPFIRVCNKLVIADMNLCLSKCVGCNNHASTPWHYVYAGMIGGQP